jgi:hypothetical protein
VTRPSLSGRDLLQRDMARLQSRGRRSDTESSSLQSITRPWVEILPRAGKIAPKRSSSLHLGQPDVGGSTRLTLTKAEQSPEEHLETRLRPVLAAIGIDCLRYGYLVAAVAGILYIPQILLMAGGVFLLPWLIGGLAFIHVAATSVFYTLLGFLLQASAIGVAMVYFGRRRTPTRGMLYAAQHSGATFSPAGWAYRIPLGAGLVIATFIVVELALCGPAGVCLGNYIGGG